MSIFSSKEKINDDINYTKDMLTVTQQKEAGRRFSTVIRAMQEHIGLDGVRDMDLIEKVKEQAIRKVYEDNQIHRL